MDTVTVEHAALIQWGVVFAASLVAALWDIRCRRIPNLLTLPLLAAGLLQSAVFSGWDGFRDSLLAMVVLSLPYVLLYIFAGGGAGDAKMMGAIGAWLGLSGGIPALLAVSLCAILFALLQAAFHKRFFAVLKNIQDMILTFVFWVTLQGVHKAAVTALSKDPEEQTALTMPYGPAIFAGVCIAAIYSLFVRSS